MVLCLNFRMVGYKVADEDGATEHTTENPIAWGLVK